MITPMFPQDAGQDAGAEAATPAHHYRQLVKAAENLARKPCLTTEERVLSLREALKMYAVAQDIAYSEGMKLAREGRTNGMELWNEGSITVWQWQDRGTYVRSRMQKCGEALQSLDSGPGTLDLISRVHLNAAEARPAGPLGLDERVRQGGQASPAYRTSGPGTAAAAAPPAPHTGGTGAAAAGVPEVPQMQPTPEAFYLYVVGEAQREIRGNFEQALALYKIARNIAYTYSQDNGDEGANSDGEARKLWSGRLEEIQAILETASAIPMDLIRRAADNQRRAQAMRPSS